MIKLDSFQRSMLLCNCSKQITWDTWTTTELVDRIDFVGVRGQWMSFCEGGSHADFWRCWGSNATKYSPQLAFLLEKIEKDVNCPFRKSLF